MISRPDFQPIKVTNMLKFIVISDLHIVPEGTLSHGLDTLERFETAVEFVNTRHHDADFVVIAGDLADRGEKAAYARLENLIAQINLPVYLTLGNHDDRDTFLDHFGPSFANAQTGAIDHVIDRQDHRVIVLDSSVPGRISGALDAAQMTWLAGQLSNAGDRPVIIVLHHNITRFHVPTDEIILENGSEFAALLASYGNVRQVISGHVHMSVSGQVQGVPFCTIAGSHYNIEPVLGAPDNKGSHHSVPRREGPGQIAVVLSDETSTVVHMENHLDRHLRMAPDLF